MIRIRRGVAIEVARPRPGVLEILVEVDDAKARAIAYEDLCGPVQPGDRLVLNTGAVALDLGTGGVHFVIAVERGPDTDPAAYGGHAMKLRYTPVQHAVLPVEETHPGEIDTAGGLAGAPVVVAQLHSALPAVAIAARAARPGARVVYMMTEAGALPMAFGERIAELKDHGLIDTTVTYGQAFGGDLEAVNKFSGLLAARHVARADVVVVAPGPGNLGTASRYGFASIDAGEVVNAVAALGGRPIVAPRISFAEERERHRGVSHHTLTALTVAALAPAEIALPLLAADRADLVRSQLADAGLLDRHRVVDVDLGDEVEVALRSPPVRLESMGRSFADDPDFFRAAAAAAVLALRG
jgi:uncharacterized protein DUF3866